MDDLGTDRDLLAAYKTCLEIKKLPPYRKKIELVKVNSDPSIPPYAKNLLRQLLSVTATQSFLAVPFALMHGPLI